MKFMSFLESVDWVEQGEMQLGLERVSCVLQRIVVPPFVHVVGTNGKGSVCSMVTSALVHSGKSVGTFISPHINTPDECIKINGEGISKAEFSFACNNVKQLEADVGVKLSPFERLLCVAIVCFKSCDICVIEAGMGGGLDATNALGVPLCVVLTSVGLDHCQHLGDTVEKIALTKLEVCNKTQDGKRVPLVVAPQTFKSVASIAQEHGGVMATELCSEVTVGLRGRHQIDNAMVAAECLRVLGVDSGSIEYGIAHASIEGRLELYKGVYFDGGHNADAAGAIAEYFIDGVLMVFGVYKDKNYEEMCRRLRKSVVKAYCITPLGDRGLEGVYIKRIFERFNVPSAVCCFYSNAIEQAILDSERLGLPVCVFGSFSNISAFKRLLDKMKL